MMISTHLAKISGAIVQLDGGSVDFVKFVFADTDVVVLNKIVPCVVKLRTRLASKWADAVELAVVEHFLILDGFRGWCYIKGELASMIREN